jgi:HSP20 family protein
MRRIVMSQKYESRYNEKLKKLQSANNVQLPPSKHMNRVEVRTPKIDVYESENTYFIRICLPGVRKEDLQIRFVSGRELEVKGRIKLMITEEYTNSVIKEIFQGPFRRKVTLPKEVDTSNLRFDYQGGILEIVLHKLE